MTQKTKNVALEKFLEETTLKPWDFWAGEALEVGCPKNSKHWIFDLNRTFRILKMPDLKIFRLWISVFDSLRFKLRISRISRIYSYLEKFDQFAIFVRSEFFCTFETFFALLDFFAHCILKYCCFSLESLESLHLL